ncbi:hypothetical protein AgCh_035785 [Apium graveolens]
MSEATAVKDIIHRYEALSGQAINLQKSGILFSTNVGTATKAEISDVLNVRNSIENSNYLGLPSFIGKSKKAVFNYLKDRVWSKIEGWNEKLLSKAGKAIMIKSVAQAIPSYCMSCFLIPKTLCEEIQRMLNNFWWSSNSREKKGIIWHRWETLCLPKDKGGMGFKKLYGFNLALLGKHCWNFMAKPDSLVARLYKARYFPNCHFLEAVQGAGPSYIWAGIWKAKEMLKDGFLWVIGDGAKVDIYKHRWLRGKGDFMVERGYDHEVEGRRVNMLFSPGTRNWDAPFIRGIFNEEDADEILRTPVSSHLLSDRVVWHDAKNGIYNTRDGYRFWSDHNSITVNVPVTQGWGNIWKLMIPHKARVFMWRLGRNNLPVRDTLSHKGVQLNNTCPFCDLETETTEHLFFDCQFAKSCWSEEGMSMSTPGDQSVSTWLLSLLSNVSKEVLTKVVAILWGIWFFRNKKIWENKVVTARMVVNWGKTRISDRFHAKKQVQDVGVRISSKSNQMYKWKRPEVGNLKLNVDAAVPTDGQGFSIGMLIRDNTGAFIQGKVMKIAGNISVMEAESVGVWEALSWIDRLGMQNIQVETDSMKTVADIQSAETNFLEVGNITEACKWWLREMDDVCVVFSRRQTNKAAHLLAHSSCLTGCSNVFYSPPCFLLETLLIDSSS